MLTQKGGHMKENKLTSKDLITTGIYTALYIACIFVVGMKACSGRTRSTRGSSA